MRDPGVLWRILIGVNALLCATALIQKPTLSAACAHALSLALSIQPLLLFDLAVLALIQPFLLRLPTWLGHASIVLLASSSSALLLDVQRFLLAQNTALSEPPNLPRAALLSALAAGLLLFYFALRAKTFSPALVEARLQALTARIRPHFLFNSLNAVLSLIRSEPRRAEAALEALAELFRALMRDHRALVPLADEIALCRQYLELEKLRLGDRLRIEWEIIDVPSDLKVPPLMIQPLLENAVYHGIEPSQEDGTVHIRFVRHGQTLHIDLTNPCCDGSDHQNGNRMALNNIRERLALYYGLAARLEITAARPKDLRREYHVRIILPCPAHRPLQE
ncbi:MAG: histidine kinase [Pseudomonadota bacterium]